MRYLLDALRAAYAHGHASLNGWRVTYALSGQNGHIYRAESENQRQQPLALKISLRDERQRAQREYSTMRALWNSGIRNLAPFPLMWFDAPEGLPGDVLVMEWLAGDPLPTYPAAEDKALWQRIINALVRVHSLKHAGTRYVKLRPAALAPTHPRDLLAALEGRLRRIPADVDQVGALRRRHLEALLVRLRTQLPMEWPTDPLLALIRCDPNPANLLLHAETLRVVDWENAGWSDPAFDLADLLARPPDAHSFSESHKQWLTAHYALSAKDPSVETRAHVYEKLMWAFWVVKFSNLLVGSEPAKLPGIGLDDADDWRAQQQAYWGLLATARMIG